MSFTPEFKQEFYQLLEARRSIRKFKPDAVPREVIERILAGGMQAPSGKNFQNWRFYVLTGKKRDEYVVMQQKSWAAIRPILEKQLKPSLFAFTERFFYTLGDAPVVILCYSANNPQEHHKTSIGSVYMAVENINLACFAEGLGCCTMGAPLEIVGEVDKFVGAVDELICAIVVGYPDHAPPKAPRQTEGRVTYLE